MSTEVEELKKQNDYLSQICGCLIYRFGENRNSVRIPNKEWADAFRNDVPNIRIIQKELFTEIVI